VLSAWFQRPLISQPMTVIRRRDRLVYFRISDDEFEQILKACESKGARSVSDLARSAVQEFIKPAGSDAEKHIVDDLKNLRQLINEMQQSIQQLLSATHNSAPNCCSEPLLQASSAKQHTSQNNE
jgi:hypothetical protein